MTNSYSAGSLMLYSGPYHVRVHTAHLSFILRKLCSFDRNFILSVVYVHENCSIFRYRHDLVGAIQSLGFDAVASNAYWDGPIEEGAVPC